MKRVLKRAPNVDSESESNFESDFQTDQPRKILKISRPEPKAKVVLEKIAKEFKETDNFMPFYRSGEINAIAKFVQKNLDDKNDGVLDIHASHDVKAAELTDYVLRTNFGFCESACGGDDARLYVLKYQADDVHRSTNILFHRLK